MKFNQTVVDQGFNTVTVKGKDIFTGKEYETKVMKAEDLEVYYKGLIPIQRCLPYLSVDDREFLISGMVASEHEDAFKEID